MPSKRCDTCGNEYDKAFEIKMDGVTGTYDCFECAIMALAPKCSQCGCRVIGHGMEAQGRTFCCASCAEKYGVHGLCDHAP